MDMATQTADFTWTNHMSIFLLRANTPAADAWIDEHIPDDAMRWNCAIALDRRCVDAIAEGIDAAGLTQA